MIKIDLITGFLGSGKTTFIKKYARYFINSGVRIAIIENDYGAVNVDRMLLSDLEGDNCDVETIAGGCDKDCHIRRFRTKLISMAMLGYSRVIVEPSGVFDVDEFFDVLRVEPLDRWYVIGSVISIVDASLKDNLSKASEYVLASEAANSGTVLISKSDGKSETELAAVIGRINSALQSVGCNRDISPVVTIKDWNSFEDSDYLKIAQSGYKTESFIKQYDINNSGFDTVYVFDFHEDEEVLKNTVNELFNDPAFGDVHRVKGFFQVGVAWFELNAVYNEISIQPIETGQKVIIVIGENINKERVMSAFR